VITTAEARRFYAGADATHSFDHVLRVLKLAERIGEAEDADLEIVRTAALLHDMGRGAAEGAGVDHAVFAAERIPKILNDHPPAQVRAVQHAVAAHRFRTDPEPVTLEAKVLFDADKLDAIGAVGIARAFAYGGAHGQRIWASAESVDLARWEAKGDNARDHTPVHEFVVKLSRIKERLFTDAGLALAEERHDYMVAFFRRLDAEVRGVR
jgi:uncharacterized protein